VALASPREDAEGLAQKVALLEGELAEGRRAQEVAKEEFCSLSDASADDARWLVVSEMEHQEQFKELSLLQAWSTELCLAIIGPSRAMNHLLERMRASAIHHIEMARELAALRAAVTSVVELCSQFERPGVRICDLLLGLPPDQARWADHLDEANGGLEAELTARRQVDAELEALWTLATRVQDLVLDNIDGPSSLAASLSMVVELLKGRINAADANRVHWGTRSVFVATLSYFFGPEERAGVSWIRV
jgi:hypothetical protein